MKPTRPSLQLLSVIILTFTAGLRTWAQVSFDTENSFFIEIPSDTAGVFAGHGVPFGGISGIAYSGNGDEYYLLSDGLPARFYTFTISDQNEIPFQFDRVTYLPNTEIRGEGIAALGQGLYLSDERTVNQEEKTFVWEYGAKDELTQLTELPGKYYGEMYDNSGFEGLTISPDGQKLFLGMERALPTSGCRNILPILEYAIDTRNTRTYFYDMQWETAGNGISALVALSEVELLVIERDYLPAEKRNEVNIFRVVLTDAASSNDADCPQSGDPVLQPELVFAFSQDLTLGGKPFKVNNIEGATFSADGKYLLLATDNNFGNKGARTPTQLVALRIKGK